MGCCLGHVCLSPCVAGDSVNSRTGIGQTKLHSYIRLLYAGRMASEPSWKPRSKCLSVDRAWLAPLSLPAFPATGLTCQTMNVLSSTQGQGKANGVSGWWAVPRLVRFAAFPVRPHDPRQFVDQGDSGFVMPATLFQFNRPCLPAGKGFAGFRLPLGSQQSRPRSVDQQGTQVSAALFGDAAEETAVATAAFAWGNPQP